MELTEKQKNEIRAVLRKQIEKLIETSKFLELTAGMYWGANTVDYMAEAAANVLFASHEVSLETERNTGG